MRWTRHLVGWAAVLLAVLLSEGRAAAQSCIVPAITYTPIFQGVALENFPVTCANPSDASTVHVIRVDLAQPGVALVALAAGTPPNSARTLLPSQALTAQHLQVAVNANLFTGCCQYDGPAATRTLGLAIGDGMTWSNVQANLPDPPPPPGDFLSSLIVAHGAASIQTLGPTALLPPDTALAVTGSHLIVSGGAGIAPGSDPHCTTKACADWFDRNARTLLGLSKSQTMLFLVAVDGGKSSTGSAGVTLRQAGIILAALGADAGINLDGGGSTTMVQQGANGAVFINEPSDWQSPCTVVVVQGVSCERYVAFGLAVQAPPLQ